MQSSPSLTLKLQLIEGKADYLKSVGWSVPDQTSSHHAQTVHQTARPDHSTVHQTARPDHANLHQTSRPDQATVHQTTTTIGTVGTTTIGLRQTTTQQPNNMIDKNGDIWTCIVCGKIASEPKTKVRSLNSTPAPV